MQLEKGEETVLTNPPFARDEAVFDPTTTHRGAFNDTNGDVATQRKAGLGVRSQLRAQMILEEAKAVVAQEEAEAVERARPPALTTAYRETQGGKPARHVVKGESMNGVYLKETPVTLYTGNPSTGEKMVVPGKTAYGGVGHEASRSAAFSHSKFAIGTL